jgi:acetyl-CoA carboxylase biotin carboxyl carrier protein
MDLNYVKKLVKLLSESDVDEIEIEEEGKKIRIVKRAAVPAYAPATAPSPVVYQTPVAGSGGIGIPAHPPEAGSAAGKPEATKFREIKSPIVGTFYRSPAPDAAPFVQVGTSSAPGSVLCIIEAMKLMNEIESDVAGKIVQILVENGQPVEYDQPLFLVDPS